MLHAKNEACWQPVLNLQIARAYLSAADPAVASRTWQMPMDAMTKLKTARHEFGISEAMQDGAFDIIRDLALLQRQVTHFLKVLETGRCPRMYFCGGSVISR